MIHSLCSAYHWSYEDAMKRTIPQIIMLNFEAFRQQENSKRKIKAQSDHRKKKEQEEKERDANDPIIEGYGMRRSELEKRPDLLAKYLSDWN